MLGSFWSMDASAVESMLCQCWYDWGGFVPQEPTEVEKVPLASDSQLTPQRVHRDGKTR